MSTKIEDAPTATVNKYEDYKTKCIDLLNKLITPCPKVNEQPPDGMKPKPPDEKDPKPPDGMGPKPDEKDPVNPDKSSTVLKHNGQVGSLEELIVFLIKAPINDDLKLKLNDVYKIFNPTARDIVSKQPPSV